MQRSTCAMLNHDPGLAGPLLSFASLLPGAAGGTAPPPPNLPRNRPDCVLFAGPCWPCACASASLSDIAKTCTVFLSLVTASQKHLRSNARWYTSAGSLPRRSSCSLVPLLVSNTRMSVPFSLAVASLLPLMDSASAVTALLCALIKRKSRLSINSSRTCNTFGMKGHTQTPVL